MMNSYDSHGSGEGTPGGEDNDIESRTIWVGGIPASTASSAASAAGGGALAALFGRFGAVKSVTCRVKSGGPHKSWAFVTFEEVAAAQQAQTAAAAEVLSIGGAELPAFELAAAAGPPGAYESWRAGLAELAIVAGLAAEQLVVAEKSGGAVHVRVHPPDAERAGRALEAALGSTAGFEGFESVDKACLQVR